MKNQYLLSVLLICLSVRFLSAQARVENTGLDFHLDKPFYVTGDLLRYQLYLPADYTGQEIALKISLMSAQGESLASFFQLTGGATKLDGYLKIPYDLRSAVYHLLVLGTERSSLKKIKLAEIAVPVYNDLVEERPTVNEATGVMDSENRVDDLQLTVQLSSGPFQKRDNIEANIKVTDKNGDPVVADLSISVIDAGLFGASPKGWRHPGDLKGYESTELSDQMYLNGRISGTDGRARESVNFGAYIHDLRESLVGATDEAGYFALPLPRLSGPTNIQFIDLRNDSLQVVLDDGIELGPTPPLPFNEQIEKYLKWSRSRKVIYQLYNTLETNLEQQLPPRKQKYLEPDQRIIRSEYPDFKNLAAFFIEVGTPLKFRPEKEGLYTAQMFNPNPRMRVFYQGNPLFIIDGKMTRDVAFIQQIELTKIDTIDLFFDFFKLNASFDKIGSSGIAVLKTSIPNLRLPASDEAAIFTINGLLPEAREILPDNKALHRPDFRSNLFWAPNMVTGRDGQAQLGFSQSDDLGTFLIQVVARSVDGRMGIGQKTYEVQW